MFVQDSVRTIGEELIFTEQSLKTIKDKKLFEGSTTRHTYFPQLKEATDNVYREKIDSILNEEVKKDYELTEIANSLLTIASEDDFKKELSNFVSKISKYFSNYSNTSYYYEEVMKKNPILATMYNKYHFDLNFKTRELMFKNGENSIAFRIGNDNFSIFYKNIKNVSQLSKNEKYKQFFEDNPFKEFNYMQDCITQSDMDKYNQYIADYNSKLNYYCQTNKLDTVSLKKFYKQLLSLKEVEEVIYDFEDKNQIYEFVDNVILNLRTNGFANLTKTIAMIKDHTEKVFIDKKHSEKIMFAVYSDMEEYPKFKGTLADLINKFGEFNWNDLIHFDENYINSVCCQYLNADKNKEDEINSATEHLLSTINSLYRPFIFFNTENMNDEVQIRIANMVNTYREFNSKYNQIRNIVTKKSFNCEEYSVDFNRSHIGEGFTDSLQYYTSLFSSYIPNEYYLVTNLVSNVNEIFESNATDDPTNAFCWFYKSNFKLRNIFRTLCMTTKVKEHFENSNEDYHCIATKSNRLMNDVIITKETYQGYLNKDIKAIMNIAINFLSNHTIYSRTNWIEYFGSEEYTYAMLDAKMQKKTISCFYKYIPFELLKRLESEGSILLGKIYNKDLSTFSKGKPNRDTLILQTALSLENIARGTIFDIASCSIYHRTAAKDMKNIIHRKGSYMVNKYDVDKHKIPDYIYQEIYRYVNGKLETYQLSDEAKAYMDNNKIIKTVAKYDIVKDRRYLKDHFYARFNVMIRKTRIPTANGMNEINPNICLSIDLGERTLIAYTVKDNENNKILEQGVLHNINGIDYNEMMNVIAKERNNQRKSWIKCTSMKKVKEAYLGNIINEISKIVQKYHCIIVLEDLNKNFFNKRSKIEKNIYQQFAKKLANHFETYFDKKDIFNVKQYVNLDNNGNLKSDGIIQKIFPSYTSNIDRNTGFINNFSFNKINKQEEKFDFFKTFDAMSFDGNNYVFQFDYNKFNCIRQKYDNGKFTLTSEGTRIVSRKIDGYWKKIQLNLNDELNKIFADENKTNIKDLVTSNPTVCNKLFQIFKYICQMRNSDKNQDYIFSPAIDKNGKHFDTRLFGENYNADIFASENIGTKAFLQANKEKFTTTDYLNYFRNNQ